MTERVTESCPYCGRPLVTYTPGETGLDLHPKASVTMTFGAPATVFAEHGVEGRLVEGSAVCMRRRCRWRRWRAR